jgi:hypothetical protein
VIFTGLSCGAVNLCAAALGANPTPGAVAVSTDAFTAVARWKAVPVDPGHQLTDVSCAGTSLCAAVGDGDVATSGDPADSRTWTARTVDSTNTLSAISCPSADLCVAVDDGGNVATSTAPTTGAWTLTHVDNALYACSRSGGNCAQAPLTSVSCPSTTLCVAVDGAGNILSSTSPTGASDSWSLTNVSSLPLNSVSCSDRALCVAIGNDATARILPNPSLGNNSARSEPIDSLGPMSCAPGATVCLTPSVTTTGAVLDADDPDGSGTWVSSTIGGLDITSLTCVSGDKCLAVDSGGGIATGR